MIPVRVHTEAQLRAQVDDLLAAFPHLGTVARVCCSGHTRDEVFYAYGPEAADAWDALEDARFLLGDPEAGT